MFNAGRAAFAEIIPLPPTPPPSCRAQGMPKEKTFSSSGLFGAWYRQMRAVVQHGVDYRCVDPLRGRENVPCVHTRHGGGETAQAVESGRAGERGGWRGKEGGCSSKTASRSACQRQLKPPGGSTRSKDGATGTRRIGRTCIGQARGRNGAGHSGSNVKAFYWAPLRLCR